MGLLKKRRISSMYGNTWRDRVKRTEPDCSVVLSDGMRGNGHNPKHRRCPLNIRNDFVTVRVTKHWHTLPSEFVESPFPEILKIQNERCAVADLGLRSGIGVVDLQRHLRTSNILWFPKEPSRIHVSFGLFSFPPFLFSCKWVWIFLLQQKKERSGSGNYFDW